MVICRLQTQETLMGRSHCAKCDKQIAWYDNVPLLSFLLLRGTCRYCKKEISWQYPMVECGTGVLFAAVGYRVFSLEDMTSWIDTVFYLGLFSMLIVVFVYDLLTMYIPMTLVWTALVWTSVYLAMSQWLLASQYMSVASESIAPYIFSGLGAFIFFWSLVKISHETWMGMGDAYLALLVGLVVGFPGVLWAMTLSFGLGALIGVLLIALGKKGMKSQVPFAPFLVIGIILVVFLPRIFPELQYLRIL